MRGELGGGVQAPKARPPGFPSGIACQNAAYLAAICNLELRLRATKGGRVAIWELRS